MSDRFSAVFHPLKNTVLVLLILSAAGYLLYAQIIPAPFIYDDINNIKQNPHIRLTSLSWSDLADIFQSRSANRPLANLTIALNYFFHRHQVGGYHLVNLLIHILTAGLIYVLTRQTIGPGRRKEAAFIPLLTALLWLVNPVHIQSVTYTVQRMNSLAAMFCLLTLVCYIQARLIQQSRRNKAPLKIKFLFTISLLSFLAALASKEIAACLPLLVFLYEWYFFQKNDPDWLQQQIKWIAATAVLLAVIALIYLEAAPIQKIVSTYDKHDFTLLQRLLTEPRVVLYYLSLLLFPHPDRLALLYDFPRSTSPVHSADTLLALVALAALLLWALSATRKQPLLSFAVIWFLVCLVIESSVIGLALVFEHRTYLPSVFLFIALVTLAVRLIKPEAAACAVLVAAIIISGAWTWQRNQAWGDRIGFWQDNAAKFPGQADVYNNWGQALLDSGDQDLARRKFHKALRIDPDDASALVNLGSILQKEGKTTVARRYYQQVLKSRPAHVQARFNLAMILHQNGETEQAVRQLTTIMKHDPFCAEAAYKLGLFHRELQKPRQALTWFEKAARLQPDNPEIYNSLGVVLRELGHHQQALTVLKQGLRRTGPRPDILNTLGLVRMDLAQYDQAADLFKRAVDADPAKAAAWNNLGLTMERTNRTEAAIRCYNRARRVSPDYDKPRRNLIRLFLSTDQPGRAIPLLRQSVKAKPDNPGTNNQLALALTATGQEEEALEVLEKFTDRADGSPLTYYNLACLYARRGQEQTALDRLQTALAKGYDNREQISTDPDLEEIRKTSRFQQLLRKYDQFQR
ncbi:MAG: tetratricopeptide repeat protein [Desulfosudaceae bacterium]